MIKCTCGSNSVGAPVHSYWCDVVTTFKKDAFEFLRSTAAQNRDKKYLYVSTEWRDPQYPYEDFKKYARLSWSYTSEAYTGCCVGFPNCVEVYFIREMRLEDNLKGGTNGVLIETPTTQEKIDELKRILSGFNLDFIYFVDPSSKSLSSA